jgi:hypothetical protein
MYRACFAVLALVVLSAEAHFVVSEAPEGAQVCAHICTAACAVAFGWCCRLLPDSVVRCVQPFNEQLAKTLLKISSAAYSDEPGACNLTSPTFNVTATFNNVLIHLLLSLSSVESTPDCLLAAAVMALSLFWESARSHSLLWIRRTK